MNQAEYDKWAYSYGKDFLLQMNTSVTPELLEKYLHLSEPKRHSQTIPLIYKALLISAQNANMRAKVIGESVGGIDNLGVVLCSFQPSEILAEFTQGWEQVLAAIERELQPRGQIRRAPRSIWPQYCKTILSAANFLVEFSTADEFYQWVDFFDRDNRSRSALPLLLEREIDGIGFALACDFLKELGYINFAKPDIHIRDIFTGIGLCPARAYDYDVFKAVVRVAMNVGVTPYNVDKLFWLIGSGNFYEDAQIGNNGRVRSLKKEFIKTWKDKDIKLLPPLVYT